MGQEQSNTAEALPYPKYLFYLDNFRTYLTALVILHHTAISYGGSGNWFYKSRYHTPDTSFPLIMFNAVNQSYFMRSFFSLSGYFSAEGLRRKKAWPFLRTKFIKLDIPLVVYTLLGPPALIAIRRLYHHQRLSWNILINSWKSLRGIKGPIWYLALLLILDSVHALRPSMAKFLTQTKIVAIVAVTAITSFAVRLAYPIGQNFKPLNLQLGYVPQYVTAYTLGCLLPFPPNPLLTSSMRIGLGTVSLVSAVGILGLVDSYPQSYTPDSARGGANLPAFLYAVWNEITGYLLGASILRGFRNSSALNKRWGPPDVGRCSYAAFLVHPIVCVAVQMMADEWNANGIVKTAVVGTLGNVGSWGVGWGLTKVPFFGRVLI